MSNGNNAIKRLGFVQNSLGKIIVEEILQFASDLNASIQDRVINEGLNAEGDEFGTYAAMTRRAKERKRHTQAPYPSINFVDTGQMFNSVRPKIEKVSNDRIVVSIGTNGADNANKMKYNVKRFGTIIEPSEDEFKTSTDDLATRINRKLNSLFR